MVKDLDVANKLTLQQIWETICLLKGIIYLIFKNLNHKFI